MFIGLNPSTADEIENDPTVTRCIERSKQMGHGGLLMGNIFAFRATDPDVLLAARDPVGPETDEWLLRMARRAGVIVAAWGTHGKHLDRGRTIMKLLRRHSLLCLGQTKAGHPKHPLYLSYRLRPVPYNLADRATESDEDDDKDSGQNAHANPERAVVVGR